MFSFWKRTPRAGKVTRRALRSLADALTSDYRQQIDRLALLGRNPGPVRALCLPLVRLAQAQADLAQALQDGTDGDPSRAASLLRRLSGRISKALLRTCWTDHPARALLVRMLDHLLAAEAAVIPLTTSVPAAVPGPSPVRVVVPPDLLRQCYRQLFPAERMLIASGRRNGNSIRPGKVFDVTGDQGGSHVRADPAKLGQALIEMDQDGFFLAFWIHSHPGVGVSATCPSGIDLRQHQDWLRHYSEDLLSIIVVNDRWVRFWGTALEGGRIELEVTEHGVIKENENGYVFRLDGE